jgi:hypothetical protein
VESKERFPHPHSLYDGGETQETKYQIGVLGSLPPFAEYKTTLCYSHRLWLIVDERAMKLSHSVSTTNPIRSFAGNLCKACQTELSFHHRRSLLSHRE